MARNTWDDDNEDFDSDEGGPADLRKALKKAQAENAALRKANEELQTKTRAASVADVLKDKGVSAKLSKFILRDIEGDPTPEAVEDWLTENADLFGIQIETKNANVVSDDDREALRKIADIDNSADRPVGEEAQIAALNSAKSMDDLKALFGLPGQ